MKTVYIIMKRKKYEDTRQIGIFKSEDMAHIVRSCLEKADYWNEAISYHVCESEVFDDISEKEDLL